MGNVRGSKYSMKHRSLNPLSREFWQFSFHEMGIYDLTAMINCILYATQKPSLFFVGHNQGTTALLVLLSSKPEYGAKVLHAHLMAPVAFMDNPHPLLSFKIEDSLKSSRFSDNFNFFSLVEYTTKIIETYCPVSSFNSLTYCTNLWFFLFGRNLDQTEIDPEMLLQVPTYISPTASLRQWDHFLQLAQSGTFRSFDFKSEALPFYNFKTPTDYNLTNVRVPIYFYHAAEDLVVSRSVCSSVSFKGLIQQLTNKISLQDVERLKNTLTTNVREYKIIPNWNHMDFVYSLNARILLYKNILTSMNNEGLDLLGYVKNLFG